MSTPVSQMYGRYPNQAVRLASRSGARAFTLLELLATMTIASVLLAIAVPSYRDVVERQRISATVSDLGKIGMLIERYRTEHIDPPMSLAQINAADMRDPWGNPYRYLNFAAPEPGIQGRIRKDHNLHPINSEFDLYSMGPDGDSRSPLTAQASRDDILWARDGSFIGVATDF